MTKQEILNRVDHTLLLQTATQREIQQLCDDAIACQTASVCIPPSYLDFARNYVNGKMTLCTVIGFPNGNSTTASKVYETQDAIKNGATEIDMVINIGHVKDGRYADILSEINAIKEACGFHILKVIIESCLLTETEIIELCKIVSQSNADYIKTSTGFSTSGATFEVIALMEKHCDPHLSIKAAGGISSFDDAEKFIELGADRLGTSRLVKLYLAQ